MEGIPVRRLDGSGAPASEVGGKATSLDRLVGLGFPVPPAVALTAAAYREFVSFSDLDAYVKDLAGRDLPPSDALDREMEEVDAAFRAAPMPPALEAAVREAAGDLLAGGPVAVRSSATAEDLTSASFAGQYRTFLELEAEDAVLEAVRACWASLWAPSARAYRRRTGIPEDDLAMGVIVQAMVPAEWAGVLFTRDPQGETGHFRVEAVRGLGEALVSGRVTPHDFRVDRATLALRGGPGEEAPPFLEDLLRLGLRIERRLGAPQDVEWAYAHGELRVLQARPITTTEPRRPDDDGFDTEAVAGTTFTPVGVQEMLPGVIPPLLWTINAPMLDDGFRRLFGELGIPIPEHPGPFVALGRFRGRAALNLSVLREASASMPGGSRAEVERQYLGRVLTEDGEEQAQNGGRLRRALAGFRAVRTRRRVESEVGLVAEAVDLVLALGIDLAELPVGRFLAYRTRVRDLAWRGYAAEVAAAAGAAATYRALELALERWVGPEEAPGWAQRVTAGPVASEQAGCNSTLRLWDLYTEHVEDRAPYRALASGPPESADERVRALGEEGERFLEAVQRAVRHFGSMAVYGGPTWDEDPAFVWSTLVRCHDCLGAPPADRMTTSRSVREEALGALMARLRRSWKWRVTRVLTGQVVDVRRRLLRRLAQDASRFLALRERAKAALLVLGGEERRLIMEAARRLESSGLLESRQDVELLADSELEQMLLGEEPVSAPELARRREALRAAEDGEPLPDAFDGLPGVEEGPPIEGDVLEGWAASAGRARGRARVVASLAEASRLAPGEILVARSTDPSWTPLFLTAGGIVLEQGGPLSHAAIVAREFGVPAVLNVKGATRAIVTGDIIEVDGTAGVVVRATREEAA